MQTDFTQAPEVVEANALAERAVAATTGYTIATVEQYNDSAGMLKKIKAGQKRLEELRTTITGPMNAAIKAVNDLFRAPAEKLLNSERSIKQAISVYADEQPRIRREEQRKADEAARKEQARLQEIADRAAAKGQDNKAEAFQERAQTVVAPVIQREAPKVAGISMREAWKFEITDGALVPREYLAIDEGKIRRVVLALKGDTNIPGVRVYAERQVAAGVA